MKNKFLATVSILILSAYTPCEAAPQGGIVNGGSATISTSNQTTVINQNSSKVIIDWNSFDIGANETVDFKQPSSSSIALNRIHDNKPSQIQGNLTANGHVMLINPNGVVFGSSSKVDVGSLTATSANIDNNDFFNDRYIFDQSGHDTASIVNDGHITIADEGLASFVAPNVVNNGVITASLGRVALAGADKFVLDMAGDNLISIELADQDIDQAIARNSGIISASGGEIVMTASGARSILDSLVENTNIIEANSIENKGGKIILSASDGTTKNSGKITASGKNGGGEILIGGDYRGQGDIATSQNTIITKSAVIRANATEDGDGGKVVIWADDSTYFAGDIESKGGENSGNGGFVETSGKNTLVMDGNVTTTAPNGKSGSWLLDPTNVTISNAGATNPTAGSCGAGPYACNGESTINATNLLTALNAGSDVTITTVSGGADDGDITVADALNWTGSGSLQLDADNDIILNNTVTTSNTSAALILNADGNITVNNLVTSVGDITMGAGDDIILGNASGLAIDLSGSSGNVFLAADMNIDTMSSGNGVGSIKMGDPEAYIDLGGSASLGLYAGDGINVNTQGIANVSAQSTSGDISINNTVSGEITLESMSVNGLSSGSLTMDGIYLSGALDNNNITIHNDIGNININDRIAYNYAGTANNEGYIHLDAGYNPPSIYTNYAITVDDNTTDHITSGGASVLLDSQDHIGLPQNKKHILFKDQSTIAIRNNKSNSYVQIMSDAGLTIGAANSVNGTDIAGRFGLVLNNNSRLTVDQPLNANNIYFRNGFFDFNAPVTARNNGGSIIFRNPYGVGSAAINSVLDESDLAQLNTNNGFIQFGQHMQQDIHINTTFDFDEDVVFDIRGAYGGDNLYIDGDFISTNPIDITFQTTASNNAQNVFYNLGADISTNGGDIWFRDSGDASFYETIKLTSDVNLLTNGGDIVFDSMVNGDGNGPWDLTMNAGGGNVDIANLVGNLNGIGAFDIISANHVSGDGSDVVNNMASALIANSYDINANGTVHLGNIDVANSGSAVNVDISGNDIIFGGVMNMANAANNTLVFDASSGSITFDGTMDVNNSELTIQTNNLTANGAVESTDDIHILAANTTDTIGIGDAIGDLSLSQATINQFSGGGLLNIGSASHTGDITIDNLNVTGSGIDYSIYGGNLTIDNDFITDSSVFLQSNNEGDIVMNGRIQNTALSNALTLNSTGAFINNYGASALSATNDRYLVYVDEKSDITANGLTASYIYSTAYPTAIADPQSYFAVAADETPDMFVYEEDVPNAVQAPEANVDTTSIVQSKINNTAPVYVEESISEDYGVCDYNINYCVKSFLN